MNKCNICKAPYNGYGNNAAPVKDGRCCDICNQTIVIPARMQNITNIYVGINKSYED